MAGSSMLVDSLPLNNSQNMQYGVKMRLNTDGKSSGTVKQRMQA